MHRERGWEWFWGLAEEPFLHLALALVSLKARHAVLGMETESPLCCPGDHPIEFMVLVNHYLTGPLVSFFQ